MWVFRAGMGELAPGIPSPTRQGSTAPSEQQWNRLGSHLGKKTGSRRKAVSLQQIILLRNLQERMKNRSI